MKINDVIKGKSSSKVITITPDKTVRDLLALLAEHNIGAVVVSGDGNAVDGIVSERDVVRKLNGNDAILDATVDAIMTSVVADLRAGPRRRRADGPDDREADPPRPRGR